MQSAQRLVCICGPTAAGKSAAVMRLAQSWPIEIIVMDSATIYRGMDIGTAKPSAADQREVAHHLLDIRDPAESYSAAEFASAAAALVLAIQARGKLPVLCGGTMLYYKALRLGLNDLPQADAAIRAEINIRADRLGWPAMHTWLAQVDAPSAARLAPNDSQRVQRALEVYLASGQSMSQLLAQGSQPYLPGWEFVTISLEPAERGRLHAQIARRYQQMLAAGLLDEVQALYSRGDLTPSMPSVRCVGYRQIWDYLAGNTSLDEAIERAIAATRQLAKRQFTWLRALPERLVVDSQQEDYCDRVAQLFAATSAPRPDSRQSNP